jgi:hypothetical protein
MIRTSEIRSSPAERRMINLRVILQAALGLPLGFFLPGYLLARLLTDSERWLWAFPLSLVVTFWAIFSAGLMGLPVTAGAVSGILITINLILLGLLYMTARKIPPLSHAEPRASEHPEAIGWIKWAIIAALIALGAAIVWRMILWPLAGPDTPFRWDLLAQRMLEQHSFAFYPPIKPDDYRFYFFTDGIPPLVSFSYWWTYAVVGGHHAGITVILIVAQLATSLGFVFAIGRQLHSSRAGILSAGILGGSSLFLYGTAIGEEAGLTILSMAAMLYAIVKLESPAEWRCAILAGVAAGCGALAREYGVVIPALGCLAIFWRGKGWQNAAILAATAFVVAGPWYIRNAVLTGNPFFSDRFGSFYVNPVHSLMMDFYRGKFGVSTWTAEDWLSAMLRLLGAAPLQLTIGIYAAAVSFRKYGYLAAVTVVFFALWIYSIGFMVGGASNILISARVFAPALIGLSVLAGVQLAGWSRFNSLRWAGSIAVLVAIAITIAAATVYPTYPSPSAFEQWTENFTARPPPSGDWWSQLPQVLPQGSRVLSDDAYMYAGLYQSGIEIVPVWSPEVSFIDDPSLSPRDVRLKMLQQGIHFVVFELTENGEFLSQQIPFYAQDRSSWRLLAHTDPDHARLYELTPDP